VSAIANECYTDRCHIARESLLRDELVAALGGESGI